MMRDNTYTLVDTHNNQVISRHRTPEAAARANAKYQRAVKRTNGDAAYVPTKIVDAHGAVVAWPSDNG